VNNLNGKRILLGVTGGIAAYKSAELTRLLVKAGAEVRVVMTQAATEFVTPLTFQALSGNPVRTRLLDESAEAGMGHIELARWADRVLIAPATANTMARLAHGMADDLLSTVCLACDEQILIAPAMNHIMWQSPATQQNAAALRDNGMVLLGPDEGEQACGDTGPGRMLEPGALVRHLSDSFSNQLLAGTNVLITAGPTREAIDPVRFISNKSSGKMGYALAAAARESGANVILISGPVSLNTPEGVHRIDIETAQQMGQQVLDHIQDCQILIGAAAVADYVPATTAQHKLKKSDATMTLSLVPGMDILGEVARIEKRPFTVGFAAETRDLEQFAQAKRLRKSMDMIAANYVGADDRGFDSNDNELSVFWEGGQRLLPLADKHKIARQLIALVGERFHLQQDRRLHE
jgi:phosphopantothenoylcysteine decarboxylase/phosphopantothenate--cysteine ligase